MLIKDTADHIFSVTPQGVSIYILAFLGVVLLSLAVSGNGAVFPEYLIVFLLFCFTIYYIYIKLIVPNPVQL
jgi:hypothetical protein